MISCARSTVKCRVESQFLAVRLAECLSNYLTQSGEFLTGRGVLLFGYGIVGRSLALRLREAYSCEMQVVEGVDEVRRAAQTDGFTVYDDGSGTSTQIVVGATGKPAVSWQTIEGLIRQTDRVVTLASVSSGEVEFSAAMKEGLRCGALKKVVREPWGMDAVVLPRGRLHILADGRPINFFSGEQASSLAVSVGDLVYARLMEALGWRLSSNENWSPGVYEWAARGEGGGRWLSEEEFLGRFCALVGMNGGSEGPIEALSRRGLYSRHPSELRLGVGVDWPVGKEGS